MLRVIRLLLVVFVMGGSTIPSSSAKDHAQVEFSHDNPNDPILDKELAEHDMPRPPSLEIPKATQTFFENHCYECHDGVLEEGGLNLEMLSPALKERELFEMWVEIHDRVRDGVMPPNENRPPEDEIAPFLTLVSDSLIAADDARVAKQGRAKMRRLNRYEYENALREGLDASWMQVAYMLPEDRTSHLFNKVSDSLDFSHVQMRAYLATAEHALRMALGTAAFRPKTERFYARTEPVIHEFMRYRERRTLAIRTAVPLLGTTPQPDVIRGIQPLTVGEADPEVRELEAMGFVADSYGVGAKYDFTRMMIPIDGRYFIRMKTYTYWAGPNGANGGDDHGLTGGSKAWWQPDRNVAFPGTRSEPVTLYALEDSGATRWLGTFDSLPETRVIEREVVLKKGEMIRPGASRLTRARAGRNGNHLATETGMPGFAMNWLEIEGPLYKAWPPAPYKALFDELPFTIGEDNQVRVSCEDPDATARHLLLRFVQRMFWKPDLTERRIEPFFRIYKNARELGEDFTDAMIAAYTAALCSTDFLFLENAPGPLDNSGLATRLSLFLWNGPPDQSLLGESNLAKPSVLRQQTERLLNDPRQKRFVNAFLDYWLDLRNININAPDAQLYPEYYIDDLLTESSLFETRRFFTELIDNDMPARNLVDSNFTFINERLAKHYGLPEAEGVALRRVKLPNDSPRGGLLTQASLLRITANGTTTTPVVRGAWMMERIIGVHIPSPPSGIEAITPDTRGAVTIREQLAKHRATTSCASCHNKFDPLGFALESFDIAGGWRDRYRALGEIGEPVKGVGKNGHLFTFNLAQPVDCSGELMGGRRFENIMELKALLLKDERAIARNLLQRFIVYATGAPVSFADRSEVETMLDECAQGGYGVRSLIQSLVQSEIFRNK